MSYDFKWKDEYSVHVEEIDNQHKKLVELIFKLFNALNENSAKEELGGILSELIEYAEYHFSTEEKYFKKFKYEYTDEHNKEHRNFEEKMIDLQKKHIDNEIEISFELIDFLENWLLEHLITADQKYVECFKENNLK
jgi:hemerythrin-like metal-binding protein